MGLRGCFRRRYKVERINYQQINHKLTTGERLKVVLNEVKRRRRITQAAIAGILGVSPTSISKAVLNMNLPSEELLTYLWKKHKVPKEYILEGRGPMFADEEQSVSEKLDLIIKQNKQILKLLKADR